MVGRINTIKHDFDDDRRKVRFEFSSYYDAEDLAKDALSCIRSQQNPKGRGEWAAKLTKFIDLFFSQHYDGNLPAKFRVIVDKVTLRKNESRVEVDYDHESFPFEEQSTISGLWDLKQRDCIDSVLFELQSMRSLRKQTHIFETHKARDLYEYLKAIKKYFNKEVEIETAQERL